MINFGPLILASEEAANTAGHAVEHAPTFFTIYIEPLINSNFPNFLIAVAIIAWLVLKYNLLSGIGATQKKIIEDLENAVKNKDEAIANLKIAETKLNNAKNEADKIIQDAEKTAMKIRDEIIKDAEQEAVKIIEYAKKAIENEQEAAKTELRHKLTAAAVEVARDNIINSLNEDWHKQIISDFVEKIPNIKVK